MNSAWISVKDRLPEPDVDVLIYAPSNAKWNAMRAVSRLTSFGGGGWLNCGYARRNDISHWQPLPDDPPLDRLARPDDGEDEGEQ